MKTLLLLIGSVGIALSGTAYGENQNQSQDTVAKPKTKVTRPAPAPRVVQPPKAPRPPQTNPKVAPANQPGPKPQYPNSVYKPATRNTVYPVDSTGSKPPKANPPTDIYRPKPRIALPTPAPRETNNGRDRNRHWRDRRDQEVDRATWAEACRRHRRDHHDRHWWTSHYTRFVLFGGGYYFWDAGYWYPAYGYDAAYNTYDYEAPIYAYNDLEPSEIVASVQTELQRLGYYVFEIDGLMGPETRKAISNYQRDNGLEITSAIDQPTLESLGLD